MRATITRIPKPGTDRDGWTDVESELIDKITTIHAYIRHLHQTMPDARVILNGPGYDIITCSNSEYENVIIVHGDSWNREG